MISDFDVVPPNAYSRILAKSQELGFSMNSDVQTGSLLRTLAAAKPGGHLLELGTGCGLGTCWLLDGMSVDAHLTTVDTDPNVQAIAIAELGTDSRLSFHLGDGGEFLETTGAKFDLIYADAWPGKYSHRDVALSLLKPGGVYLIDDMLPQPNWPEGHGSKADRLLQDLQTLGGMTVTPLSWSTGIVLCVKK